MGKSMKLGGGGRFAAVKAAAAKSGASDPGAVAAAIGRRKYGNAKMQSMAEAGKARAEHKKSGLAEALKS